MTVGIIEKTLDCVRGPIETWMRGQIEENIR